MPAERRSSAKVRRVPHSTSSNGRLFRLGIIAIATFGLVSLFYSFTLSPLAYPSIQSIPSSESTTPSPSYIREERVPIDDIVKEVQSAYETRNNITAPSSALRPTYMLIRVIGNSLAPRQKFEQTLANLRFTLEHEQLDLKDHEVATHWIVNRIVRVDERNSILALLDEFEVAYTEIPFDLAAYSRVPYRVTVEDEPVDAAHALRDSDKRRRPANAPTWVDITVMNELYDAKSRYTFNLNGARNEMLDIGKRIGARWVFPWDQNCFVQEDAWTSIKQDLIQANTESDAKYFVSWMDRLLQENDVVLQKWFRARPWEEPQLIFRNDSVERFDERLRYGKRDKAALLVRLGVKGPWDQWGWSAWETDRTTGNLSTDIGDHQVQSTGHVIRLFSGRSDLENIDQTSAYWRELTRGESVLQFLQALDERVMREMYHYDAKKLVFYNVTKIAEKRALGKDLPLTDQKNLMALASDAAKAVQRKELWTVTSNSPVDAFRNTRIFSNFMEDKNVKSDAKLMKHFVYDTTALVLTWQLTKEQKYAKKAVEMIETWCVDNKTSMHAAIAFMDLSVESHMLVGRPGSGRESGIRHLATLSFWLDMVRLLMNDPESVMDSRTKEQVMIWITKLYTTLQNDRHAVEVFRPSPGLFGLQYDLVTASFAAFLDKPATYRFILGTLKGRLLTMVEPTGELLAPPGIGRRPYALLTLSTLNLLIELTDQVGVTNHLFEFDMNAFANGDREEEDVKAVHGELVDREGVMCRLIAAEIPCCSSERTATGHCVKLLQRADMAELMIFAKAAQHALDKCPSLAGRSMCSSLANTDVNATSLSMETYQRYLLPPYPFLR